MLKPITFQMIFHQSILFCLCLCFPYLSLSQEITNTITSISPLTDPNTLVSPAQVFRFGFFSPPNSTNRYLGVFYVVSEETIVWVANRNRPLNDSSGVISIARDGNLVVRNGRNDVIWRTNVTTSSRNSTNVQLLDTGNLVLRHTSTDTVLWDSFSQPTDVFLPTMRLFRNTNTNASNVLSSWRNTSEPDVGNYTVGLEVPGLPQLYAWQNGRPYLRSGVWNGQIFIGIREMYTLDRNGFGVDNDRNGTFYLTVPLRRFLLKLNINYNGSLTETMWNARERNWQVVWASPLNRCDIYGICGPFGICNDVVTPICSCARGFEPANQVEWDRGNWTNGCVRRRQLSCDRRNSTNGNGNGDGDGFLRVPFTKVPDFAQQLASREIDECRAICLGNCSCTAYAHDPNIGCMFWSGSLIDTHYFGDVGVDLYIRVAASELGNPRDRRLVIIIPVVVGFAVILISLFITWCCIIKRKGKKAKDKKLFEAGQVFSSDSTAIVLKDETDAVNIEEFPLFTFDTLANSTDHFNENNLLGKGGFGLVYKGTLTNGKEIAVKRLSSASGQGNREFMNEVIVVSKLQHKNLVRLLGCCVEREEKMLIYEYMPNKSLDGCLFDPAHASQKLLDWNTRFGIIEGIGRGLLYLHRDSRLKIIHRDLKPSNVLLDEEWKPKISDFGMARIFGGNEDHLNTKLVVGTHGYMAPEYAMEGRFSEKSDVYSFGVLMLEVLSGKKSSHYHNEEQSLSMSARAWKLWNENNAIGFVDQAIASANIEERDVQVRCVQTALLCVQEFPNDRPAIQTVLAMLNCEIIDLPKPSEPVFAEWNSLVGTNQRSSRFGQSVNELTLTVLDGR